VRQAAGQPVTEGRVKPLVAMSARAQQDSAPGIKWKAASSHVGAFPGRSLAKAPTIVSRHGVRPTTARRRDRGPGQQDSPGARGGNRKHHKSLAVSRSLSQRPMGAVVLAPAGMVNEAVRDPVGRAATDGSCGG
jgi:hypothetical protein